MKKIFTLALASLLSVNSYAIDQVTNGLAYTLAYTIWSSAMGVASTKVSAEATLSKYKKEEALKIENDAQNYYMSGIASAFLEEKIKLAQEIEPSLSESEAVDVLVEAAGILLNQ